LKRLLAEILGDVFAAELLFLYDLFHPEAQRASIGLPAIANLAARFQGICNGDWFSRCGRGQCSCGVCTFGTV
jgi:hypothetical protein